MNKEIVQILESMIIESKVDWRQQPALSITANLYPISTNIQV